MPPMLQIGEISAQILPFSRPEATHLGLEDCKATIHFSKVAHGKRSEWPWQTMTTALPRIAIVMTHLIIYFIAVLESKTNVILDYFNICFRPKTTLIPYFLNICSDALQFLFTIF